MWNEKFLRDQQQKGKIRGYVVRSSSRNAGRTYSTNHGNIKIDPVSKEKSWLSWNLQYWANENCLLLETEYKFDEKRKWRFDFAFAAVKIAIEYEGIFSDKSRHTTIRGYTGDIEKYNAAALAGWQVIRLTAKDYKSVLQLLNQFLKNV